jgi:uncharacterized protein (DUF1499 family)
MNNRHSSLSLPILAMGVAVAAAVVLIIAGFGSRLGWWHFHSGFNLLTYGAYGGVAAATLASVSGILAFCNHRTAAIVLSAVALLCGLTVVAVPLSWRLQARQLPMIHDITTDTVNPPQFVTILPRRSAAPNPADYGGPAVAQQQKAAYPDLRSEVLNIPPSQAFEHALAAARILGWQIVASDPVSGRIEASDTTFWFGFFDDIVIRIAGVDGHSLVDARSVSRVGKSDVGTNARRIRNFIQQLRNCTCMTLETRYQCPNVRVVKRD